MAMVGASAEAEVEAIKSVSIRAKRLITLHV